MRVVAPTQTFNVVMLYLLQYLICDCIYIKRISWSSCLCLSMLDAGLPKSFCDTMPSTISQTFDVPDTDGTCKVSRVGRNPPTMWRSQYWHSFINLTAYIIGPHVNAIVMKHANALKQFTAHMKWYSQMIFQNLPFWSEQSKSHLNSDPNLAQKIITCIFCRIQPLWACERGWCIYQTMCLLHHLQQRSQGVRYPR